MGGLLGFILSFEGSCITGSHNRRKCNVLAVGDKIQPLAGRALLVAPHQHVNGPQYYCSLTAWDSRLVDRKSRAVSEQ